MRRAEGNEYVKGGSPEDLWGHTALNVCMWGWCLCRSDDCSLFMSSAAQSVQITSRGRWCFFFDWLFISFSWSCSFKSTSDRVLFSLRAWNSSAASSFYICNFSPSLCDTAPPPGRGLSSAPAHLLSAGVLRRCGRKVKNWGCRHTNVSFTPVTSHHRAHGTDQYRLSVTDCKL